VYLVYVLEILKLRHISAVRLRRTRPHATEADVDEHVERQMETGEFEALRDD
jgi:UDP-GlcNAc:undecaprenyl-phosphate/decaprenyl-phosphate GlcNAc-1-phosphate transferase